MLNFIKKWSGEGKIRADVICDDGTIGTVKVDYMGDINTLDEKEFTQRVKRVCYVEHGKRVTNVAITGYF